MAEIGVAPSLEMALSSPTQPYRPRFAPLVRLLLLLASAIAVPQKRHLRPDLGRRNGWHWRRDSRAVQARMPPTAAAAEPQPSLSPSPFRLRSGSG